MIRNQIPIPRFIAGSILWLIRLIITSVASYALSAALYRLTYLEAADELTRSIFPGNTARVKKMARLWPPFDYPFLWALHSAALLLIFGRFAKEQHLVDAVRRLGWLKGGVTPLQNLLFSFLLCILVAVAEFQLLLPMIRLSEMHPIILFMDFFYMLQTSFMAKIAIRSTSFSIKLEKIE